MRLFGIKSILFMAIIMVGIICLEAQFAGGRGTQADPWQIETAEHLDNLRNYLGHGHSDKYFIQISNIDLGTAPWNEGQGWEPIGTDENNFHGQYDGDGHTINGLYINRPEDDLQGLFGKTHAGAVSNLGLTNVDITGNHIVGALVALNFNNTPIRNCFSQGSVLGKGNRIGGLVGENNQSLIVGSYCSGTVKGEWLTGGLTGYSFRATIESCYTDNNVTGVNDVGGLVGQSNGSTIDGNYSTGDITGISSVGGLIGTTLGTNTTNCYSTGSVRGDATLGGLIGNNANYSFVDRCYSTGSIKGERSMIGGLTGQNFVSTVSNSYSIAIVQGPGLVGGLVGFNHGGHIIGNAVIENSYSTGYVRGDAGLGGLVGRGSDNYSIVLRSYWNLETSGQLESFGGSGLTTSAMTREESFEGWDFDDIWSAGPDVHYPYHAWQETAAPHNYPGPYNLTCSPDDETYDVELNWQMQVGRPLRYNIYRNDNHMNTVDYPRTDYVDENVPEDEIITYWVTAVMFTPEHGEFETTPSNWVTIGPLGKFAGGGGSANNPWQINTAEHLHNVRYFLGEEHRNKHFIQTADVDLTGFLWDEEEEDYINEGRGWVPIGKRPVEMSFFGTYNGNGHIIEGLYINRPEENNLGLFGNITYATIKNLRLPDINIVGNSYVGGLVGHIYFPVSFESISTIDNCFVTGNIKAVNYVGGLVGTTSRSRYEEINNSYSKVNVTAENNVGGLVGYGSCRIFNCYSAGTVEGEAYTGGLVGRGYSMVTNSYWDIETSGQETSARGEGRTTEQMTYPYGEETFVDWDFQNIWAHDVTGDVNNGYPCLFFQISPRPDVAVNPIPENQETGVPVDLENISWEYIHNLYYTDPAGFRVYFNKSEDFDDEEFVWVPFIDDQEQYSSSEVLPDKLQGDTVYYWKVVSTTEEPQNGHIGGGDAKEVPVWSFTTEKTTKVEDEDSLTLSVTELHQNYPNPFNPETTISFSLAEEGKVTLDIFNSRGQKLICLVDDHLAAGNHTVTWNGKDRYNNRVSSGVYFYRMTTEADTEIRKMLIIK